MTLNEITKKLREVDDLLSKVHGKIELFSHLNFPEDSLEHKQLKEILGLIEQT